jgi:UMF1 family MFS transporter
VRRGPPSSRTILVAWALYDFGNSAFSAIVQATVWPVYYATGVVGNTDGRGDFWLGLIVSVAMILVAFMSPVAGGIADHAGARKLFLIGFTLTAVAAMALLATVRPGMVLRGFLLGVVGLVAFEAAIVFYNSYLPRIAEPNRLGRASAAGFAAGYAGSLIALLTALPFVTSGATRATFVVTAALFGVFAIPSLVVLPTDTGTHTGLATAIGRGVRETWATLGEIASRSERTSMRRFLIAYLVYEDGVNTVIWFSAPFASTTLGFSFTEIIVLFMVVQMTALVGALAWARPADRLGPKTVVSVTLVQWAAVTLIAFFVTAKWHFWVVAILAGTGLGAIQAASRTFMATLVPPGREAEFFGFYGLVGKTGAILGPVLFGTVSTVLGGNQRAAIVAVGAFFGAGFALLRRVQAGGPTAGSPRVLS